MRFTEGKFTFSAIDLSHFLGCPHRSLLDRRVLEGGPQRSYFDGPTIEVLRKLGQEHELANLARLEEHGKRVVRIDELRDVASPEHRR